MHIVNHVADRRKALGLTQEELAARVGVTRRTIISLEKGHYTPSLMLAFLLADALKVDITVLFQLWR